MELKKGKIHTTRKGTEIYPLSKSNGDTVSWVIGEIECKVAKGRTAPNNVKFEYDQFYKWVVFNENNIKGCTYVIKRDGTKLYL